MQSSAIRNYESSLEANWNESRKELEDDFSLGSLMELGVRQERGIAQDDWQSYLSGLTLSKSSIKFVKSANDNTIVELSEAEIDYVVGGVAAVPVLGAVVVVAAAVALAVAVFVAAGGFVSIYAAAATHVWVSS
ncbi:hypothetical protein KY084_03210 [Stakelama sp. CBK3Z-3]|uniref:Uncharacterized protein n=1 Tax=Stakelama flava TaxID=2860338 RepID=A0ABS6XI67_9SPHN|nr:hypothetical protein [Stakelama flava]MBW4329882.1 hypothetical protein [Stakelama flava]